MYLFSIIVPFYNVEQYLDECIQSLVQQTYTNLEIILVDDGSTDSSHKISEQYKKQDSRIQIIRKINGGQSSARNEGLKHVTGDYVVYVDSDDYISLNYIELVEEQLQLEKFDMIVAKTVNFIDGTKPEQDVESDFNIILNAQEALETAYYQELFDISNGSKIIKTEIAKKYFFPEGMIYEDFKNMYKYISECKSILFMSKPKYFYRKRLNSTMNSDFNNKNFILIDIAQENLDFIQNNFPEITDAAIRRYVLSNLHILGRICDRKDMLEKSKELRKNVLKYRKNILQNKRILMKEKAGVCILSIGLKSYKCFWKLYHKNK